jgi:TRAP-type C4-dicarboxylate transport system permease small subunit
MKWLPTADRLMDRLARLGRTVSSALLILMVILINVEVVGRYFFKVSTLIADEYSAYFFVGCTFFGFSYSFRQGHFLRVSLLTDKLPSKAQALLHCGAAFLAFVLSSVVTYEVAMLTLISIQFNSVSIQPSATPLWIPQVIMPIGMGGLSLLFLSEAVQTLNHLFSRAGAAHGGERT